MAELNFIAPVYIFTILMLIVLLRASTSLSFTKKREKQIYSNCSAINTHVEAAFRAQIIIRNIYLYVVIIKNN